MTLFQGFEPDPTPDAPRPPVDLEVLRRQLRAINDYVRRTYCKPAPPAPPADPKPDGL